jgi:flagellar basal-body rod modification protein FlgD
MSPTLPVGSADSQSLFGTSQKILGKDDFLKLLVTQLRNQNPMNPMRSEEFAAQLAQFSSVEQLNNISDILKNSVELDVLLNKAITNTMATTLIGRQVKAVGNTVSLVKGDSVNVYYNLSSAAKKVTLQIKDSDGNVVRTVELDGQVEGNQTYAWDGKDDAGNRLSDGKYSFSVTAVDTADNAVATETYISGLIRGVRYENGEVFLRVGDLEIRISDVLEIGDSPESNENQS